MLGRPSSRRLRDDSGYMLSSTVSFRSAPPRRRRTTRRMVVTTASGDGEASASDADDHDDDDHEDEPEVLDSAAARRSWSFRDLEGVMLGVSKPLVRLGGEVYKWASASFDEHFDDDDDEFYKHAYAGVTTRSTYAYLNYDDDDDDDDDDDEEEEEHAVEDENTAVVEGEEEREGAFAAAESAAATWASVHDLDPLLGGKKRQEDEALG